MATPEEVRQALFSKMGEYGPAATIMGTIKSVDEDNAVCVLVDSVSGQDLPNIRLRPVLDGDKSITIIPSINAMGVAVRLESGDRWMLIHASKIDKYIINIAEAVLEQNENGLLVQNGEDTLRDALTLLIEAVQQIIVIQGRGPDLAKLQQSLLKVQNILRNA